MEATFYPSRPMSRECSDRLARAAVQDPEALASLYTAHAPHLYRYFWIQTRSKSLAEDLVSETFLGVLRTLENYDVELGSFSAWLYGAAHHVLARHAAEPAAISVDLTGADDAEGSGEPRADTVLQVDERIDLWQAVSRLAVSDREIIALKFGAGLTHPEIAEVTRLQPDRVGVRLYRALQKLRTRLIDEEGGDA